MCQAWHLPPLLFKSSCDISISFSFVVLSNLSSSNAWNATHASTFRSLWVTSGSISTEGTNFFFWRLCSFSGRETVFRVLPLVILQRMIWIAEVQHRVGKDHPAKLWASSAQSSQHFSRNSLLALQILPWKGCSGSLGRSAETGGEHTVKCIILIEIFTVHNRPMSPKSFNTLDDLRLKKINCVYSQKKQWEFDSTSVGTIGRDCWKWVEQSEGAEFLFPVPTLSDLGQVA